MRLTTIATMPGRWFLCRMFRIIAFLSACLLLAVGPAAAQDTDAILSAVVGVKMRALPDASSNATLGRERTGSGVVIDDLGHILTIGYIVTDADSIEITTNGSAQDGMPDRRTVPATLVAYDPATGFGLLHAVLPLGVKPMPLGDSAALGEREPVMVLPAGGRDSAMLAYVVSKRSFAGGWEYMLDSAIYTSPPTLQWAGAALIDHGGKLVGIGSLLVRDSMEAGSALPGNMFVPTDVVKPILADLIAKGHRSGPVQPWLGMSTEESQGRLFVTRVSAGGPAERAGIHGGDIVIGVGSTPVRSLEQLYRSVWALGAAGVEVPLRLLQGVDLREVRVRSVDRQDYMSAKSAM